MKRILALCLLLAAPLSAAQFTISDGVVWSSPGGHDLQADIYVPAGKGPFPVAIYLHGGSWTSGDRKQLRRQALHMVANGVAGVAIEYRLAPEYKYPAAFEDAQAAGDPVELFTAERGAHTFWSTGKWHGPTGKAMGGVPPQGVREMKLTRRQFALTLTSAAGLMRAQDLRTVKARRKPGDEWHEYPARPLDLVKGFHPVAEAPKTDAFGGRLDRPQHATGFFHPAQLGKRWYLIDPAGNPYIQAGICALATGKSATNLRNLKARFWAAEKRAAETSGLLRANGFTASGGWSDVDVLRTAPHRLTYCTMNNFMGDSGRARHLTHQQSGRLGYANDYIPVFHPEFAASCDATAQKLAAAKSNPYLPGHFSDKWDGTGSSIWITIPAI